MLILLPPSEGKTRSESGPALALESLSFPELTETRELLLRTLVRVSSGNPKTAMKTLTLGPALTSELAVNAALASEPTARADEVFTGVLFENADLRSLTGVARQRADRSIVIASGLFGLLRPADLIPAYRLAPHVVLPRLGTVQSRWKRVVGPALETIGADDLVIDMRSGAYAAFGSAPPGRTVTLRVLSERDGKRTVVSHFNKAAKGRIVSDLIRSGDDPASATELIELLTTMGWAIEPDGNRLDVVLRDN